MNKILLAFAFLIGVCFGQSVFLRELAVPRGSINQFADWIQQIERSEYLDCPTNENRFGLTCDPAAVSRDDLDNYFCGSQPNEFGWCGAYWEAMHSTDAASNENLNSVPGSNKRGVSNGALPINTNNDIDAYERYQMYLEMFGRVCSCHCGCTSGCSNGVPHPGASGSLFCGFDSNPTPVGPEIILPGLEGFPLQPNTAIFIVDEVLEEEVKKRGVDEQDSADLSSHELDERRAEILYYGRIAYYQSSCGFSLEKRKLLVPYCKGILVETETAMGYEPVSSSDFCVDSDTSYIEARCDSPIFAGQDVQPVDEPFIEKF